MFFSWFVGNSESLVGPTSLAVASGPGEVTPPCQSGERTLTRRGVSQGNSRYFGVL